MASGTLLFSGNYPFQFINSSALNSKLRSCNMIKRSTDHHALSHMDSMMMNSLQRPISIGKERSVSRESMESSRSSDGQLPVMRMFQKFVTTAGIVVECTHRGCKPVFDEEDSNCQAPHECPSLKNIVSDILGNEYAVFGWKLGVRDPPEMGSELIIEKTGKQEAAEVVGMYASFLWATEEEHDQ